MITLILLINLILLQSINAVSGGNEGENGKRIVGRKKEKRDEQKRDEQKERKKE